MKPFMLSLVLVLSACGGAAEEPTVEGDVPIAVAETAAVQRGNNTFTLTTAAEVTKVDVSVWMPSMGHGAPNEPHVVKENGTTYRLEDVVFSMPGTWELKVNVTTPNNGGSHAFRFEVP